MENLLKKYIQKIVLPHNFFGNTFFMHSARKINPNDKTKIVNYGIKDRIIIIIIEEHNISGSPGKI